MIAVGLIPDYPGFYVGGLLQFIGFSILVIALRPGWKFQHWRHPSWKTALRRITIGSKTAIVAFVLVVAGVAVSALWIPPEPTLGLALAEGHSPGIAWWFSVTEVPHVTCLTLETLDEPWSRSEFCGRPFQPRESLSAARMALRYRTATEGTPFAHFIAGTVLRRARVLSVTGKGLSISIPREMLIEKERFPFRFFIFEVDPKVTSIRVEAWVGGTSLGRVDVPDRPNATAS